MSWNEDVWKWIKSAPLPVVLVLSVLSAGVSIRYTYAATQEAKKKAEVSEAKAEDAAKKADAAAATGDRTKEQVDEISKDVKKLLEAIGRVQGTLDAQKKKP